MAGHAFSLTLPFFSFDLVFLQLQVLLDSGIVAGCFLFRFSFFLPLSFSSLLSFFCLYPLLQQSGLVATAPFYSHFQSLVLIMGRYSRYRLTTVLLATTCSLFGSNGVIAAPAPAPQVTPSAVASGAPNPNACGQIASVTSSLLAASPSGRWPSIPLFLTSPDLHRSSSSNSRCPGNASS